MPTGSGASVKLSARSAISPMKVPSAAESFPELGSVVSEETDALLTMLPEAPPLIVTSIVMVALAPEVRSPTLQVTVPETSPQTPALGVADTNVTSAGRVSIATTLTAAFGPALATVRV